MSCDTQRSKRFNQFNFGNIRVAVDFKDQNGAPNQFLYTLS